MQHLTGFCTYINNVSKHPSKNAITSLLKIWQHFEELFIIQYSQYSTDIVNRIVSNGIFQSLSQTFFFIWGGGGGEGGEANRFSLFERMVFVAIGGGGELVLTFFC
jgi:hypothetical protein